MSREIAVPLPSVIITAGSPIVAKIDIDSLHHFVESLHDDRPQPIEPQIVDRREKMAQQKVLRPTFHALGLSATREVFERGGRLAGNKPRLDLILGSP